MAFEDLVHKYTYPYALQKLGNINGSTPIRIKLLKQTNKESLQRLPTYVQIAKSLAN